MKFSIGVIGATGYIGTAYRQEIREAVEEAEIVALCARRRDRLEAAAKEDGATLITHDWREVVQHPEVNLVLVLTPDALHYEPVLACAKANKHVFCEKPVSKNCREAHQMLAAYSGHERGHFVPFWTRYVSVFCRVREMVMEGALGEIQAVVYRWHNPRPVAIPFTWRDDATLSAAGSVGDVGSHAYDTIRWILGSEARRVNAHADMISPAKPDLGAIDLDEALAWGRDHTVDHSPSQREATAFDYGNIAIEFHSGAVGSILLSHAPILRKGLAPELELHGTQASLSVDRVSGNVILVRSGEEPQIVETVTSVTVNRFANFVFPAMGQRATGLPCDHPGLEDGWRVQVFTDAVAQAAKRGRWIELAEIETENL